MWGLLTVTSLVTAPDRLLGAQLVVLAWVLAATALGQAVGWYRAGDSAGFIGAVIGAVIILFIYRMVAQRRVN